MKVRTVQQITKVLFLVLILSGCGTKPSQSNSSASGSDALSQQSVNAVIWYATSAENAYIYEQTYELAAARMQQELGKMRSNKRPAVILDIDETVLDNSPYMLELAKNGETFSQKSWDKWVQKEDARPLPGVMQFLNICRELSVEVFFVSNRSIRHLQPTINNLMKEGIDADLDHVLLKEETSDKTERREKVKSNHEVVLYIGDNLRDFDEVYKDRSKNGGRETVQSTKGEMMARHILLPNPMYGQWERIFDFPESATQSEKAAIKVQQTQINDY